MILTYGESVSPPPLRAPACAPARPAPHAPRLVRLRCARGVGAHADRAGEGRGAVADVCGQHPGVRTKRTGGPQDGGDA